MTRAVNVTVAVTAATRHVESWSHVPNIHFNLTVRFSYTTTGHEKYRLSRCDVMMSTTNLYPFLRRIDKFMQHQKAEHPRISLSSKSTLYKSLICCNNEVRLKLSASECSLLFFFNSLCIHPSSAHGRAIFVYDSKYYGVSWIKLCVHFCTSFSQQHQCCRLVIIIIIIFFFYFYNCVRNVFAVA